MIKQIITGVVLLLFVSCQDSDLSPGEVDSGTFLPGTWILFQQSYSPGGGMVVETVDPEPAQTITFMANHRVQITIDRLSAYAYYRVFDDPVTKGKALALFIHDPGNHVDLESSNHSYMMWFEGDTLNLGYRWCIEGCLLELKKVD